MNESKITKFLSVILIGCCVITVIVGVQLFFAYNKSNKVAYSDNNLVNQQNDNTTAANTVEDTEITELKNKLNELQQNSEGRKTIISELDTFFKEYGAALKYRVDNIPFKDKQTLIKNQLSPYFAEDAWEQTDYYEECTKEEFVILKDNRKMQQTIFNQSKYLYRTYYRNVEPTKADVYAVIGYNNSTGSRVYEYELLKAEKINDEWKIADYKKEETP